VTETDTTSYTRQKAVYVTGLAPMINAMLELLLNQLEVIAFSELEKNVSLLTQRLENIFTQFNVLSDILSKLPVEGVFLGSEKDISPVVALFEAEIRKLQENWETVFSQNSQVLSVSSFVPSTGAQETFKTSLATEGTSSASQSVQPTGFASPERNLENTALQGSPVPSRALSPQPGEEQIDPTNLDSRLQRDVCLPVPAAEFRGILTKLSYGAPLLEEDRSKLKSLNLADLAKLVGTGGLQLDLFRVKVGDVSRIIFSFKKGGVYVLGKEYVSSATNNTTISSKNNFDGLKLLESKLELVYIVTENKETISSTSLLEQIHKQFFLSNIRNCLPSDVILDTIQYQVVYPAKTKGSFTQLNVSSMGGFRVKAKPCANLSYLVRRRYFLGGGRNSFKILFPFFSSSFKDPYTLQKYSAELES